MIPLLLVLIPLLTGLVTFFIKNDKQSRAWVLFASCVTLFISLAGVTFLNQSNLQQFRFDWMQTLGSSFDIRLDGMGTVLCLLTAIAFPLIFMSTWAATYKKAKNFYALMLLSQAGLMGVFVAMDALLFYFFWELALIPIYFLVSQWGGPRRIKVTFKLFIYTFVGSVLMLIGILYLQSKTADHSFALQSFYNLQLSGENQLWVFWLFFFAFAIKMPIFPFHTWQPDAYEESPTAVTMVLSGIMVKMGLLGVIRWLLPVLPIASYSWGDVAMSLSVIGVIYASLIAMRQDDMKRLVAYASIAHIGLMAAAVFSVTRSGMHGVMMQMFNHGINIIGLWFIVEIIERKYGTRKISELGGLAQTAPVTAIFFVIITLANIALPLTNAFPGEFLMLNGVMNTLSKYYMIFTVAAGLGIIFGAIYMLNMVRKVFYGETNSITAKGLDLTWNEQMVLGIIVVLILFTGIFPDSLLAATQEISNLIINKADISHLIKK